jgi:hypothetical protein
LIEHQFDMTTTTSTTRLVHRTAHIRLRATRHQTDRCYQLLRAAGDVWAWLLDDNRERWQHDQPPITNYQALCRQLTNKASFGELSMVGARSVLRRYSDAWFAAANRRRQGQQQARFPRRKRALIPVRFYNGTFLLEGQRVRLPVAKGRPALWVRLARPIPYPPSRSAPSPCWPRAGGCGWPSLRPCLSNSMTWTQVGWPGSTSGSSTPTR